MNTYIVLYRIESIMGPLDAPFGFVCRAGDADHAEEQCLNAYPDCAPVWCAQGDDYSAALEEYWTTTEGGAE